MWDTEEVVFELKDGNNSAIITPAATEEGESVLYLLIADSYQRRSATRIVIHCRYVFTDAVYSRISNLRPQTCTFDQPTCLFLVKMRREKRIC